MAVFFSIIIPTYNRPSQLTNCLESIVSVDYPKTQLEIIVVDDGSPNSLENIVATFQKQLPISLLKQENKGPAAARNYGASIAKGEYLAFTDDDCLLDKKWLNHLSQQFHKTPDRMLGGQTINQLTKNVFAATSQLIIDLVYQHYNVNPQKAQFFASNNMAMSAEIFKKMGGFNTHFKTSEDRELCARWLQQAEMIYVEQAIIYHAHALNLWQFCRQHFNYGKGAYYYHQHRKGIDTPTAQTAIGLHSKLTKWLLFPFKKHTFLTATRFSMLLLIWQIVNLLGFISAGIKRK